MGLENGVNVRPSARSLFVRIRGDRIDRVYERISSSIKREGCLELSTLSSTSSPKQYLTVFIMAQKHVELSALNEGLTDLNLRSVEISNTYHKMLGELISTMKCRNCGTSILDTEEEIRQCRKYSNPLLFATWCWPLLSSFPRFIHLHVEPKAILGIFDSK